MALRNLWTAVTKRQVTLVKAADCVILVDCGDPWNGREVELKLKEEGFSVDEVTHLVVTHGHVDHCGNLSMFKKAQVFMALDFAEPGGVYKTITRESGHNIVDGVDISVMSGHTSCDLVVTVKNTPLGTVVVAGDLFESSDDESTWQAVSGYPDEQIASRRRLNEVADYIVPGHGLMFKMANRYPVYASLLRRCLQNSSTTASCSFYSKSVDFNTARRPVGRANFGGRKRVPGVPADRGGAAIEDLVVPRTVTPTRFTALGSEEYSKGLEAGAISLALDEFSRRPMVRDLAGQNGLNSKLFMASYKSFRTYCLSEVGGVEPTLLVVFHDIIKDGHDVDRLFPFFLAHARKVFPHLEAMDDLRMISDLTQPHNWYPEARTIQRKIIFHAGPTNSGKTFHALKRFSDAKSGVYCGPLKLLAAEVYQRSNEMGLKCDMVTGEERRYAVDNLHPSAHLSSTVEMLSTQMRVEVAVIDEIQMLRDDQRGWAWTRALLGVAADEVHLCGEPAAITIVQKLLEPLGEHVEIRHYERKTPLTIATQGIGSLDNIQPGDCIVCFSRKAIFQISKKLESIGIKPALIYGDLPPGTKLAQAAKFNDPNDPCNVLVATDAVGMGLNLNIRRVIFHSCTRQGELLPAYSALQIAGRAGRYGTAYADGVATTLRQEDNSILREILSQTIDPIKAVGVSPTFEQIETFSFHLPQASFVHLLDLFVSVSSISDHFFICTVQQMKELAELIDYIPLPLKVRYTFCISPLNVDNKLTAAAFVKMARRFSSGQCLTFDWLMDMLNWPPEPPTNLTELVNLERVYEVLDAYLWLSLRFPDMLPDEEGVREASRYLDGLIQEGIENILALLENEAATGKEGSMAKKLQQKAQTAKEKREFEELAAKDSKLPEKRRGKRKTVLETVMARAALTQEELEALKKELRDEKNPE